MEKRDSILTNFKSIDYEGLKLEQSLIDFSDLMDPRKEEKDFVKFDDIYYGIISLN